MQSASRAGRIIGVLMILQMAGSGLVNAVLEAPLFGAPGFLVTAAPHARQIGLAALLGLATEAVWVGIAVAAFPVLWQRARTMAFWLAALAIVCLAVAAAESSAKMSMVSLSEAYARAGAADTAPLQAVRVAVAAARNWTHYMGRLADGVTILVFYAALYRCALVPRVLAGFGLIAVTLMLASVGMPLFGHDVVFPMLVPIALSQLIIALWLIARGVRAQPDSAIEP